MVVRLPITSGSTPINGASDSMPNSIASDSASTGDASDDSTPTNTTLYWRFPLIALGLVLLLPILLMRVKITDHAVLRTRSNEGDFLNATVKKQSSWDKAILEAQKLLSKNATKASLELQSKDVSETVGKQIVPSCLVPNLAKTAALVKDAVANQRNITPSSGAGSSLVPLPVLNVGMPKGGSTTLFGFFDCIGFHATHWRSNNLESQHFVQESEAICMRDAVRIGLPPLATCASNKDALMQMDFQSPFGSTRFCNKPYRDNCFFPQLSLLEDIHAENPNATFVINFRPIHDWIHSVLTWGDSIERFQQCHLPNLPRGFPEDLNDPTSVEETMTQFFCSHVLHIRQFVELYPSHALIELDLYDTEGTASVMSTLFTSSAGKKESKKCWGRENYTNSTKTEGNHTNN